MRKTSEDPRRAWWRNWHWDTGDKDRPTAQIARSIRLMQTAVLYAHLASVVKSRQKELRKSTAELARSLNWERIDVSSIIQVRSGKASNDARPRFESIGGPPLLRLFSIAESLGIPTSDLFPTLDDFYVRATRLFLRTFDPTNACSDEQIRAYVLYHCNQVKPTRHLDLNVIADVYPRMEESFESERDIRSAIDHVTGAVEACIACVAKKLNSRAVAFPNLLASLIYERKLT